jgi:hypothetical protein
VPSATHNASGENHTHLGTRLSTVKDNHAAKYFRLGPVAHNIGHTVGVLGMIKIAVMVERGWGSIVTRLHITASSSRMAPFFVETAVVDPIVKIVQVNCYLVARDGEEFDKSQLKALSIWVGLLKGREELRPAISNKRQHANKAGNLR